LKITTRQREEVDFLAKHYKEPFEPTNNEVKDYIFQTALGGKLSKKYEERNRLIQRKRSLDIMVKMWTEDLSDGLLGIWELLDNWKHPHFKKVARGIIKGIKGSEVKVKDTRSACMVYANKTYYSEGLL